MSSCAGETQIVYVKSPIPEGLLVPCDEVELKYRTNEELAKSLILLDMNYNICKSRLDSIISSYHNGIYMEDDATISPP